MDPQHFSSQDPQQLSSLDPQHFSVLDPQTFSSIDPIQVGKQPKHQNKLIALKADRKCRTKLMLFKPSSNF